MIKKNICIITEEFRPSLKGGIATWSTELAGYFNKQNYNLNVYLKKRGGINKSFNIENLPYKLNLISGRDWAYFKKWYIALSLFNYLRKKNKPIIFSTNWELSQGLINYKKYFQFSLITVLHGLEVTRLKSKKYKKKIKDFEKTLLLSDRVISVSNFTKDRAKSIISINKEIDVIPNFVNTENFYPTDKKNLMYKYNLDEQDIVLLSLSRLVRRKGHFLVIDLIKNLTKKYSRIKYLIAGVGDLKYEFELKNYVKKLNLSKYINFLGYINEDEKNILYNLCHLFLMTSLPTDKEGNSEGFGITFLEANACGKPVIGTRVGGIPDAIENGVNGYLINPNSSDELKKIVIKLLDNDSLYSTISKNSINHVKNNFDVNIIGKKFDSLIDRLYDSL